jgi:hypothetical protein
VRLLNVDVKQQLPNGTGAHRRATPDPPHEQPWLLDCCTLENQPTQATLIVHKCILCYDPSRNSITASNLLARHLMPQLPATSCKEAVPAILAHVPKAAHS